MIKSDQLDSSWSLVTKRPSNRYEPKRDLLEPGIDPDSVVVGPPLIAPTNGSQVQCSACTGQQHASLKSEMGVFVYATYD
jgi:hypothetical protein